MSSGNRSRVPAPDTFAILANGLRRRILAELSANGPLTVGELAETVAGHRSTQSGTSETARIETALRHNHLPALAAGGFVEYDRETGRVSIVPAALAAVGALVGDGDTDRDSLFDALAHARRRRMLSVLADDHLGLEVTETGLAVAVAAAERGVTVTDVSGTAVERVRVSFHHVHLPKLADASLVTVDREAGTITYESHPDLDEELLVAGVEDGVRPVTVVGAAHTEPRPREADVWTLSGREEVRERGQALCDHADEELVAMFPTERHLDRGVLARLQAATERGVAVSVGSQQAPVRQTIRRQVPDAAVWEPQRDWFGGPGERPGWLGRIVFADRRAVLLGTVADPEGDDAETAISGEGEDNGLVVLVREVLGHRLEQSGRASADGPHGISP